jgi:L-threonylcarbamoyladenylate synthase
MNHRFTHFANSFRSEAGIVPESLAANLFKRLREFDEAGVDVILAETPDARGIGQAVMNRLLKASGGNIIKL